MIPPVALTPRPTLPPMPVTPPNGNPGTVPPWLAQPIVILPIGEGWR